MGVKDPYRESCDYCIWLQEGEDVCDCLESVRKDERVPYAITTLFFQE